MNIIISGYGFVGRAHKTLLQQIHNIKVIDPKLGYNAPYRDYDCLIIAVSTPEKNDGSCDMSNVIDVLEQAIPSIPILIKSTISLEGWNFIKQQYPKYKISFSPEFLRANSAEDDLLNACEMLIGDDYDSFWTNLFMDNDRRLIVRQYRAEELILAKYFRNSFLALKVSFFNQIYDLCDSVGINYEEVRSAITLDERIGDSHSYVTEERGFGGHCFPKDTKAIIHTALKRNINLSILREAIDYNNTL